MQTTSGKEARRGSGLGVASALLAVAGHFAYFRGSLEGAFQAAAVAAVLGLLALIAGRGRLAGVLGLVLSLALVGPDAMRSSANARHYARYLVIGSPRELYSAEAAYASVAGGRYGSLACLQRPSASGCIAGYASTAPTFLPEKWTPPTSYAWTFRGAPEAGPSFERYCFQGRPRELTEDADMSLGIDEKGTLVRYTGLADCCGADGSLLPICTPLK